MKDITTEEAVKILKDIPFYEQVENYDVEGPRYILKTNNRLEQARDIVLKELNSKKGTINALKIALKERTDERDKKDEIINKKDKIINAMALQLSGITIWDNKKEEPLILKTEEEVKKYYEGNVGNDYEENYKSISNN